MTSAALPRKYASSDAKPRRVYADLFAMWLTASVMRDVAPCTPAASPLYRLDAGRGTMMIVKGVVREILTPARMVVTLIVTFVY